MLGLSVIRRGSKRAKLVNFVAPAAFLLHLPVFFLLHLKRAGSQIQERRCLDVLYVLSVDIIMRVEGKGKRFLVTRVRE